MGALRKKIEQDFLLAYRAREELTIGVLRLLKSALTNAEIEKRTKENKREAELTDEEEISVLKKQIKNLEESLALFQQGGREDLFQKTNAEIAVLKKYAPAELGEDAVREIVKKKIEEMGKQEFGKVMSEVMKEVGGGASGNVVARVVKELLS